MRNREREVVVTGTGVCCHMGDDWARIESALREGRPTPFARWAPAVEYEHRVPGGGDLPGRAHPGPARDREVAGPLHGPGGSPGPPGHPPGPRAGAAPHPGGGGRGGQRDRRRRDPPRGDEPTGTIDRTRQGVAHRHPAADGVDRLRQPGHGAGSDRTVVQRHRRLRRGRLQPAPRRPAHRARTRGRGHRRGRRGRGHPLPHGLRRHARLHVEGQRPARPGVAPLRRRPRRLRLLRGSRRPRPRDAGRGRGPGGDDPGHSPGLRDVLGRHRQHGGPRHRRGGARDAARAGQRRPEPGRQWTTSTPTARPRRWGTCPR